MSQNVNADEASEPRHRLAQDMPGVVSLESQLKPGESLILSLADSSVLAAGDEFEEELELEDLRLKELARFDRAAGEREKIRQFKAASGATGIAATLTDYLTESGVGKEENDDERSLRRLGEKPIVETSDVDESLVAKLGRKSFNPVKRKKAAETLRHLGKRQRTENWDAIFDEPAADGTAVGREDSDEEDEGAAAASGHSRPPPASTPVWGTGVDADQLHPLIDDANSLYSALTRGTQQESTGARTSLPAEDLVKKVKKEGSSDDEGADYEHVQVKAEVEDLGEETNEKGVVVRTVAEFAKTLKTPLMFLQDRQAEEDEDEDESEAAAELGRAMASITAPSAAPSRLRGLGIAQPNNECAAAEVSVDTDTLQQKFQGADEILGLADSSRGQGLASTLEFLRRTGKLEEGEKVIQSRRHQRQQQQVIGDDDIKIEYIDRFGRVMGPKDAFREMSYRFHGKEPGKNKQAKRLKKMALERAAQVQSPDETLPSMRALKAQQAKGDAFLVLTGAGDDKVRQRADTKK